MRELPLIRADLRLLKGNARLLLRACRARGVELAAVTKAVCADPVIVGALVEAGVGMLADSRLMNLRRLPDF